MNFLEMTWRQVVGFVRGGTAAFLLLGFAHDALAFQSEGTVRIGILEAQTGAYAQTGLQGLWGSQIAVDAINAAGGVVVDGKPVKIALTPGPNGYDPGFDTPQTISYVKKLLFDDKVLMIKGLTISSTAEAAFGYLNVLDQQGTPITILSSAVGSPGLGKISRWGFRNIFNEVNVVPNVVSQIQKAYGVKTAGLLVLRDNVYYPTIADKVIEPALKAAGIEVKVVTDAVQTDTDYSRQVEALKAANVDAVYVLASTLPAINFLKEAKRRGLRPKVFVGGVSQLMPDTLRQGGNAVDGLVAAGSYDPGSPELRKFSDEFRKRYSQDISLYAVNAYEAIYLIKNAIETSGIKNTEATLGADRMAFRDALEKASIVSITGERLKFNADHDTPKAGYLLTLKNGKFVRWQAADAKP